MTERVFEYSSSELYKALSDLLTHVKADKELTHDALDRAKKTVPVLSRDPVKMAVISPEETEVKRLESKLAKLQETHVSASVWKGECKNNDNFQLTFKEVLWLHGWRY